MWRDEVEVQMHMVDAFIEPIIRNAMEQKRLRERESCRTGCTGGRELSGTSGPSGRWWVLFKLLRA